MIKRGMFVRCPIDKEEYHRDFAIGKVKSVDKFSELVEVDFDDITGVSDFYSIPEDMQISLNKVSHCKIRLGACVQYRRKKYEIKGCEYNKQDGYYYYYLQSEDDSIEYLSESSLSCSYNDGDVKPLEQLRQYEFQNPMWFCGRSVVSKTMNVINNSLYGFSEIAGCKIYLKTHQLRTIIRCLQDGVCRNMIADEVGMGKTIEALGVLKVFLKDNHNAKVLIIVPDALVEQWRTELAYKFMILEGKDINGNDICLAGISEEENFEEDYDFVIADEVHNYIENELMYRNLLDLSERTENILLLSATPVQRRQEEYKKLLQLLHPAKYMEMSDADFSRLLELQGDVVRRVHECLENLDSYLEEIEDSENKHTEDTEEAFEDVINSLKRIGKLLEDEIYNNLYQEIEYEADDFGIEKIQEIIAYVCENYQFEKSIIRNRRNEDEDYNVREVVEISYDMQTEFNNTEYNLYRELAAWIESEKPNYEEYIAKYKQIIAAFFSSAVAFQYEIEKIDYEVTDEIVDLAKKWRQEEFENSKNIDVFVQDPEEYSSRVNNIVDYIEQETEGKKVLIFTKFEKTFDLYRRILTRYFGEKCCAFFSKNMESDERELGAYRFETDNECWLMLSDESGGEGRNFQNADFLVHIDMPWSANEIEQRIGRLDRIGRSKNKPVVSVVCYAIESLEEDLFKFWNNGIGIFTKSQSGLEIIMNSMDERIIKSLVKDFKYGLTDIIDEAGNELNTLKEIVKKERYFDVAEYKYQSINRIMDNTREMYAANEKQLFANSMMRWSALSGFKGKRQGESVIRFDMSSFSLKSAYNSLFMPPDIRLMIGNKVNQLQNRIRSMNGDKLVHGNTNYVQGTFDRKIGINNDYLHFFAPGDAIFDSIVNNAISSYKGTCAAFEYKTNIKWNGFIFTWAVYPNDNFLLENNISTHVIDKYRGFMPIEQFQCAVSIDDDDELREEDVLRVFNSILIAEDANYHSKRCIHLGSRSGINSKIDRFIDIYPKDKWNEIIDQCYSKASKLVKEKIHVILRKQLLMLKTELMKNSGAKKAIKNFYSEINNREETELNELIFKCFSRPRMVLDSVCYVRMINE